MLKWYIGGSCSIKREAQCLCGSAPEVTLVLATLGAPKAKPRSLEQAERRELGTALPALGKPDQNPHSLSEQDSSHLLGGPRSWRYKVNDPGSICWERREHSGGSAAPPERRQKGSHLQRCPFFCTGSNGNGNTLAGPVTRQWPSSN